MTTLALLTLDRGWRAGMAAVAGIALGLATHAIAVGFGAGLIVARFPWTYDVLHWAGVLCLLWLAVDVWISPTQPDTSPTADPERLTGFVGRGLLINILNPKSVLFFLIVVPQFVKDSSLSPVQQTIILGSIYVVIATIIHTIIVVLASRMAPILKGRTGPIVLKRILALLLVAVALWLAIEGRRLV